MDMPHFAELAAGRIYASFMGCVANESAGPTIAAWADIIRTTPGYSEAFGPPPTDIAAPLVHYARLAFLAVCGAKKPNQHTTDDPHKVTCPDCLRIWDGSEKGPPAPDIETSERDWTTHDILAKASAVETLASDGPHDCDANERKS